MLPNSLVILSDIFVQDEKKNPTVTLTELVLAEAITLGYERSKFAQTYTH